MHICRCPQLSLSIVWKRWILPEQSSHGTSPWGALVLWTWRRPSRCLILSSTHLWTSRATGIWMSSQSRRWGTVQLTGRDVTQMTVSRTPSPVWSSSTVWPRCYQRATILTREACGENNNKIRMEIITWFVSRFTELKFTKLDTSWVKASVWGNFWAFFKMRPNACDQFSVIYGETN